MKCWSAGGIALTSVPSRYQRGNVFHVGGLDARLRNAAAAYGERWSHRSINGDWSIDGSPPFLAAEFRIR
jgi:hypothetical protein